MEVKFNFLDEFLKQHRLGSSTSLLLIDVGKMSQ